MYERREIPDIQERRKCTRIAEKPGPQGKSCAISGGNRGELESYNLSVPRKTYLTRGRSVAHSWTDAVIHNDETFEEKDVCVRAEKIDRRRGA